MTRYIFSYSNPNNQYLTIEFQFTATTAIHEIQLPAWRPGRYELGNFAKNVRNLKVFDSDNQQVKANKITKDCWEIHTEATQTYRIQYEYYAADLNAGSTYLTNEQLYVNPVNCCVYIKGLEELPCSVQLNIPENYQIACSLKQTSQRELHASNFDELADSPWIASNSLQHDAYISNGVTFHLWFQGEAKVDFKKIIADFSKFTQKQWEQFGSFPFDEYHFLFQIVPFAAYHGVEHLKSTVIYLGPSHTLFSSNYSELLGVSSHELYHAWNVKSIRPIEMFPYDFTKENYSKLGYLCEGVTTYMGDVMLFRSGVFDLTSYLSELNKQLQKHFDNYARFNTNVADSSFDTWLDGYVPGAPGRKLSIYTEGCLLAFALDVLILKHTSGTANLGSVMKKLYTDFHLQNRGVSEEDFWFVIRSFVGNELDYLYQDFYHGSADFEQLLAGVLSDLGLELHQSEPKSFSLARLGIKTEHGKTGAIIKSIYPNSPAEKIGLMIGDEIIGVNAIFIQKELDEWLQYFKNDSIELTFIRANKLHSNLIELSSEVFYPNYTVRALKEKNTEQIQLFTMWSM